jgi:hypothetical protein
VEALTETPEPVSTAVRMLMPVASGHVKGWLVEWIEPQLAETPESGTPMAAGIDKAEVDQAVTEADLTETPEPVWTAVRMLIAYSPG